VFDGASGVSVYKNRDALPRAWIAYTSISQQVLDRALEMIHDTAFDPRATVIVTGVDGREFSNKGVPPDDTQITGYGPNEIDLNATAKQDGYLLLSEVYDSGWRAFVDDREVPVLRADYLFRAVLLTPGTHRVRFVYDPLSFRVGVLISGITILVLIAGFVYASRPRTADHCLR
jgi:hypothetical protein